MSNCLIGLDRFRLSSEQRGYTDAIYRSSESLLSVINNILDFSRIEAGQVELEITDFDLRASIEGAIEVLAEPARAKGLELNVEIIPDLPSLLRGDGGRVVDTGIGIGPAAQTKVFSALLRPTPPRPVSTAARAWDWPSQSNSSNLWAARSGWRAPRVPAARSGSPSVSIQRLP